MLCFELQYFTPHAKIVDESLCMFPLLIGVAPEEVRYLRQVHRVLKVRDDRILIQAGLKDL